MIWIIFSRGRRILSEIINYLIFFWKFIFWTIHLIMILLLHCFDIIMDLDFYFLLYDYFFFIFPFLLNHFHEGELRKLNFFTVYF